MRVKPTSELPDVRKCSVKLFQIIVQLTAKLRLVIIVVVIIICVLKKGIHHWTISIAQIVQLCPALPVGSLSPQTWRYASLKGCFLARGQSRCLVSVACIRCDVSYHCNITGNSCSNRGETLSSDEQWHWDNVFIFAR